MASLSGTTALFVLSGLLVVLTSYPRSVCKEMAEYDSIKEFLHSGCYPSDYTKDQKRAFRRKVSNYKYERGFLYYSIVFRRNPSLSKRNWRRVVTSIVERGRIMESCHAALQGTTALIMCA